MHEGLLLFLQPLKKDKIKLKSKKIEISCKWKKSYQAKASHFTQTSLIEDGLNSGRSHADSKLNAAEDQSLKLTRELSEGYV